MTIKLQDLKWQEHFLGGSRAGIYGFSIIRCPGSYGYDRGLFEVMDPEGEVHGWQTKKQVEDMINNWRTRHAL